MPRCPAGRVVPREERAGHVSRPQPSPRRPSPDLDTPPRSSSATRSADGEFRRSATRSADGGSRRSSSALWTRWSSSAPLGTSRARVETSAGSAGTVTGSRHASSFLAAYSISGSVGFRWSSSAPRGTSRARVETSAGSLRTVAGSRHASSFLVGYSISGSVGFRWSSSAREVRAGHVSRPRPGPCGWLRDLDTPPRSSSATRSAESPLVAQFPGIPLVE